MEMLSMSSSSSRDFRYMWEAKTYDMGGHAQGFLTSEDDRSSSNLDIKKTLNENTITIIILL
jgi:hypothetical protein